jgi:hypothetical protein
MKPDDVPEEVWQQALSLFWENADAQAAIAYAILQARSQAYEECAKMVEEASPIRPAFVTEDEGGIKWPHEAVQMPIYNPLVLAQAIRQHSQKGEDVNE